MTIAQYKTTASHISHKKCIITDPILQLLFMALSNNKIKNIG